MKCGQLMIENRRHIFVEKHCQPDYGATFFNLTAHFRIGATNAVGQCLRTVRQVPSGTFFAQALARRTALNGLPV